MDQDLEPIFQVQGPDMEQLWADREPEHRDLQPPPEGKDKEPPLQLPPPLMGQDQEQELPPARHQPQELPWALLALDPRHTAKELLDTEELQALLEDHLTEHPPTEYQEA